MEYLDSERIILEVELNPCVYDCKHEDYNNRELRRSAWLKISMNVVGEHWEDLDMETKANIRKEIQKRWKSMKDSYLKYIRSEGGKSGDANKKKKPYVYHKQMSFLRVACDQRQTSGNMTEEVEVSAASNVIEETVTEESTKQPTANIKTSSRMPKKRKQDLFEPEIINELKFNAQTTSERTQDPDEMFLLSQLPFIKKLSQSDKMDFQIRFIQLLQTYTKPHTV